MQVYRPGAGYKGIRESFSFLDVLLLQDTIAEQSAGFTFTTDVGHPVELSFGIFVFIATVVFLKGPVAVNGSEGVIADILKFGNLVSV
ncbi:hypothetical protein ES703_64939 [subsurface metagenome]